MSVVPASPYGLDLRRILLFVVMACLGSAVASSAAGLPTPMARAGDSGPWRLDHQKHLSRSQEAETKTRALFARRQGQALGLDKATANMESYDVEFYDLDLDLDVPNTFLTGSVTVVARVTSPALAALDLFLDNVMTVSETRSGGMVVPHSRSAGILTVVLDRTYAQGETVAVAVDYGGNPADNNYFGWTSYQGNPLVWTLSEPYGARRWWPCKDVNTDKADSVAVHVTVPANLVVASNGKLDQVTVPAVGRQTYHWTERYPIATYLVSVTAYPYTVFSDEYVSAAGDTMPLDYFVFPDQLASATAGYAIVPAMISAFAGLYGEYPFITEKYGHAHFLWGGGMEHQTCTSLIYNRTDEYLIAHELAHQWFGDMVTCSDYAHIWINEGFATWSEAYWREQNEGVAEYRLEMNDARYLGAGTIIVETPENFSTIFNYFTTYQKASWVPHMLRHVVGETAFRAGLHDLLDVHGFGDANTADVQAAFEGASGLDLTDFFQQWIYGEYHPAYEFSWSAMPQAGQTRVQARIAQTQTNTGLFSMPLDVRVATTLGDTTFVVPNSQAVEWYEFQVNGSVTGVALDPDDWVLCTVTETGASGAANPTPSPLRLLGNAPNPFNPATTISFRLAEPTALTLSVFDISGRLVKNLVAASYEAGDHAVRWNGTDEAGRAIASGTYFARLRSGNQARILPLSLVR